MHIKINDITADFRHHSFNLSKSDLTRIDVKYQFEEITCSASLKIDKEIIVFKGKYQTVLNTKCDYCLSPAKITLEEEFELDLIPEENKQQENNDIEITLNSRDVDYYQGVDLQIADIFEDQILMNLPLSALCSDSCEGVCPQCGVNRNTTSCECGDQNANNPFKVLKNLKLTD